MLCNDVLILLYNIIFYCRLVLPHKYLILHIIQTIYMLCSNNITVDLSWNMAVLVKYGLFFNFKGSMVDMATVMHIIAIGLKKYPPRGGRTVPWTNQTTRFFIVFGPFCQSWTPFLDFKGNKVHMVSSSIWYCKQDKHTHLEMVFR